MNTKALSNQSYNAFVSETEKVLQTSDDYTTQTKVLQDNSIALINNLVNLVSSQLSLLTQFGESKVATLNNNLNAHTNLNFGEAHGVGISYGSYYVNENGVLMSYHVLAVPTSNAGYVYIPLSLSSTGAA